MSLLIQLPKGMGGDWVNPFLIVGVSYVAPVKHGAVQDHRVQILMDDKSELWRTFLTAKAARHNRNATADLINRSRT